MAGISQETITDHLLELLRERGGTRGRCQIDLGNLVWSLAERRPSEPRPRLFEVAGALNALRRAGKVETRINTNGVRTCFLTE